MMETQATAGAVRILSGLGEIAGLYDGFILDLWGVLHDGVQPYPDTIDTLRELKRSKRRVWLLSNAPRRAYTVVQKLTEMGITEDLYTGILTSGEATWQGLGETYLQRWGTRCYHMGARVRDGSLYEDLPVELVATPEEADFVLNSGVEDFSDTAEKYEPVLDACARKGLPMICANPDRWVHVQEKLVMCAGTLADMYEKRDGEVVWFGKPYRNVYRSCLQALQARRVLAVGDSMITDIAGACGAGIDSVLIAGGLHREELLIGNGDKNDQNQTQTFLKTYPYRPNFICQAFRW